MPKFRMVSCTKLRADPLWACSMPSSAVVLLGGRINVCHECGAERQAYKEGQLLVLGVASPDVLPRRYTPSIRHSKSLANDVMANCADGHSEVSGSALRRYV